MLILLTIAIADAIHFMSLHWLKDHRAFMLLAVLAGFYALIHPRMLVKNGVKSSQTPAHFLNVDYFKKFL